MILHTSHSGLIAVCQQNHFSIFKKFGLKIVKSTNFKDRDNSYYIISSDFKQITESAFIYLFQNQKNKIQKNIKNFIHRLPNLNRVKL